MKRVLVIRLLALELAPIAIALALSAYSQRSMAPAFLAAGMVISISVALSVRDGAVLERYGTVCERHKDGTWFWFWVAAHCSFAVFFLFAAALIFLWRQI